MGERERGRVTESEGEWGICGRVREGERDSGIHWERECVREREREVVSESELWWDRGEGVRERETDVRE